MGYSKIALEEADSSRYYGPLIRYDGHASIKGPCGDTMDFWIKEENDTVENISFTTDGCVSSRACGSMACNMAQGKTLAKAALLSQKNVLDALGKFPEASMHCALLATNTLKAAIEDLEAHRRLTKINNKIIVTSGKGGVGKSTIAVYTAVGLAQKGKRVGLLDLDLHGPSIPTMLGITAPKIEECPMGLIPVESHGLKVMSIGFLLESSDDAVAWRGPRKSIMIKHFLRQVAWGELDYLIIDTPPGTGDELMAIIENAGELKGAIVVTTPQKVAAVDVRKAITFCKDLKIPILGLVENMSGLACPKCGEVTDFFPRGAVDQICKDMDVVCLSSIPMDSTLTSAADAGEVEPNRAAFLKIVNHLIEEK